jgi:tetratricopeptide (TPR) repeat protein
MTFGRLGNILFDNKKFNEAMGLYQQSLEVAQSYVRQLPIGPDVGFYLGGRYNHLGRVFVAINDMANAMRQFRLAQEAMEPWAADSRASSTFLLELSSTYNNMASVLAATASSNRDKQLEAVTYVQRAAAILESLAASDPTNRFYWSNLARDYDNLEYFNGRIGNRSAQEVYARKRQEALGRSQGDGSGGILRQQ